MATHYLPLKVLEPLGNLGLLGVWLFFTISGFLIASRWLGERDRHGTVSWRNYFVRRGLRIFPLYFLVLGLYVAFVPYLGDAARVAEFHGNLPYFLTFTFNIVAHPSIATAIFYYSWSLAAEEQFYAAWPFAEKVFRGWWLGVLGGALLLLSYVVEIGIVEWPPFLSLGHRILAYGIVEPIIWGVVLAYLLRSLRGREFFSKRGFWWCLGLAFVFLAARTNLDQLYYGKWTHPFIHLALLGVVGCAVMADEASKSPLRNRLLRRLGQISYGVYMINVPIHFVVERLLSQQAWWVVSAVAFVATMFVAELSFRYFEGPILRLKNRFATPNAAPNP